MMDNVAKSWLTDISEERFTIFIRRNGSRLLRMRRRGRGLRKSKERTERKVGERIQRCRNAGKRPLEPSPPGSDLKEEEGNEEEDEERGEKEEEEEEKKII